MSADDHKSGGHRRNQDEESSEPTEVVRKSIFILKAKPHSLKSAENFLGNRSWDLRPTTDVKMALMSLLKDPVDYALIGVDHANPSVAKLPDILSQTLKIPVILFAESLTPQSSMILRSSKYPHILFPPVSGPSIERMLLKIEKEKALAASERAGEGSAGPGHSAAFADQDMAKVFAGEGQSAMMSANVSVGSNVVGSGESTGGSTSNHRRPSDSGTTGNNFAYDPRSQGFNPAAPDLSGLESDDLLALNMKNPTHNGGFGQGQVPATGGGFAPGQNPAHGGGFGQGQGPAHGGSSLDPYRDLAGFTSNDLLVAPDDPLYKQIIEHQSLLSNCSKLALNSVAVPLPGVATRIPLVNSSQIACFDVESTNVSGVVVVAFGSDRKVDPKFTSELRSKVMSYMSEHDIDFSANDMMNLKIQKVEFEDWSLYEAAFLHKAIHISDEVALSFLLNSDLKTPLEISDDNQMLKVRIDEIRAEVPLDFDIYLHFPANHKYVRYVGKERIISTSQWNRLTARGISEVHVQMEAAPLVRRYRVQNFINDTIDSYTTQKKKAA